MNGKIYVITNNINGKIYVGQTIQDIKKRFEQHMTLQGSCKQLLYKAIVKYGRDNFSYEVIEDKITSYDELNQKEENYISELNSMQPNGYNLCPGGQKWRRKPVLTLEQEAEIVQKYNSGESAREIGNKYSMSHRNIIDILHTSYVNMRQKNHSLPDRTSKITKEVIVELLVNKALTIKEASNILNVSTKTIQRAKKRYEL